MSCYNKQISNMQKKQRQPNKIANLIKNIWFSRRRIFKIAKRFGILKFRLLPGLNKYFHNQNILYPEINIAQPAYCNVTTDLSLMRLIKSNIWVNNLSVVYTLSESQLEQYKKFNYEAVTSGAYYPTKKTALESINLQKIWNNSYYNPENRDQTQWQKKSDLLFADMMVNTQGVYKAKRIKKDTEQYSKAGIFSDLLSKNRGLLGVESQDTFNQMVENGNLYYVDYPELRWMENDPLIRQKMGDIQKYTAVMTRSTITKENSPQEHKKKLKEFARTEDEGYKYTGYLEIPFAIFAQVPDYLGGGKNKDKKKDFVCLGAVFNDNNTKQDIFHPFFDPEDRLARDRWEMAKLHMANTDNNYFIIRVHLGQLHYASAIYTTAFCNAGKKHKQLDWLIKDFIQVFTQGFLQINFLANLTLVDPEDPIAEKTMHLRAVQQLALISEYNKEFKIQEFSPLIMGDENECYQSDSVKLSRAYYENIRVYIDYLFEQHQLSPEMYSELGRIVYNEAGEGEFDKVTKDLISPDSQKVKSAIKLIMNNLVYLWVVHHSETFSIVSVSSACYFVPSLVRKPLSALKKRTQPLTEQEKQDWLTPLDVINDLMALSKRVTYRSEYDSIISIWDNLNVNHKTWEKVTNQKGVLIDHHWNKITLQVQKMNYHRAIEGNLFYLHWLMPHEMPNALNI